LTLSNKNEHHVAQIYHIADGLDQYNIKPLEQAFGTECARRLLTRYAHNRGSSYMARTLRTVTRFLTEYPDLLKRTKNQVEKAVSEHYYHVFFTNSHKAYETRASDWNAFRQFLKHLIHDDLIPDIQILSSRSYTTFFNGEKPSKQTNHLGPPLGEALECAKRSNNKLHNHYSDYPQLLSRLPNHPTDEEFLTAYELDQQQLISDVRSAATEIVSKAYRDFQRGEKLLQQGQIEDIVQAIGRHGAAVDRTLPPTNNQTKLPGSLHELVERAARLEDITALNAIVLRKYVVECKTVDEIARSMRRTPANVHIHLRRSTRCLAQYDIFTPLLDLLAQKKADNHRNKKKGLSYFSPQHPNGLANLVTATALLGSGIVCSGRRPKASKYRAFPGQHRYCEHPGGAQQIAAYLGLTPKVIAAMQALIIIETGCNVDSLRNAVVSLPNSNQIIRPSESPNHDIITLEKPRAKRFQEFLVRKGSPSVINAAFCIRLALLMTKRLREATHDNALWLYTSSISPNTAGYAISPSAAKQNFKNFFSRHRLLKQYANREPSAKKLRVTVGIARWFKTGGSMASASNQLNNLALTAARHYIPRELQEAYYTNQISRFQIAIVQDTLRNPTDTFTPSRWLDSPTKKPFFAGHVQNGEPAEERIHNTTLIIWEHNRLATVLAVYEFLLDQYTSADLDKDSQWLAFGMPFDMWRALALYIKNHGETTNNRQDRATYKTALKRLPSIRREVYSRGLDRNEV
jgi:hypothetical protein